MKSVLARRIVTSKTLPWLFVAAWMTVIFLFSNQAHSGEITEHYLGSFNLGVRKCAHMFEYFVLFLLLKWGFSRTKPSWQPDSNLWPWLSAVIYAISDEWHQSFVPGRTATINDVMVDSIGSSLAWLALYLFYLPLLRSFCSKTRN